MRAIHAVAVGEVWADRHATSEALAGLTDSLSRTSKTGLTHREQQIADACGQGLRNREIASRLNISSKTVKSHLNNIFRKLQLVIEIDGRLYHTGAEVFESDRWRQNLLVLNGWFVLRFTWAMVEEQPEKVLAMVREAIEILTARQF